MEPTNDEMKQLKEDMAQQRDDMRQLKTALIGDAELGTKGYFHKVDEHSVYIEKDKKMKWKATGAFIGLQIAWWAFMAWKKELF